MPYFCVAPRHPFLRLGSMRNLQVANSPPWTKRSQVGQPVSLRSCVCRGSCNILSAPWQGLNCFFSIVWGLICEVAETKMERSLVCGSDGWNLAAVLVLAIPLCFFETCPLNVSSGRTKKQQPLYFFSLCVCVCIWPFFPSSSE